MSAPPTIWSRLFGSRRPCSSVQEGSGFAVASQAKDPQSPYRAGASVHLKGGTANGTGFLFEIHGTALFGLRFTPTFYAAVRQLSGKASHLR